MSNGKEEVKGTCYYGDLVTTKKPTHQGFDCSHEVYEKPAVRYQVTTSHDFNDTVCKLAYHVVDSHAKKPTEVFFSLNANEALKKAADLNNV